MSPSSSWPGGSADAISPSSMRSMSSVRPVRITFAVPVVAFGSGGKRSRSPCASRRFSGSTWATATWWMPPSVSTRSIEHQSAMRGTARSATCRSVSS